MKILRQFVSDDRGVTSIEYVLIAGLVALAIIVGAGALGTQLNVAFETVSSKIPGVSP